MISLSFPLHGDELPAESVPALEHWWSGFWPLEWLPFISLVAGAVVYLVGVRVLRKRGDSWPFGRTLAFVVGGMGTLFLSTQGPLARLDTVLLWTHMVQHMIMTMIAPIFIALGAPVTLALRTLPQTLRGLLLRLLHSRFVKVITFPLVAGAIYVLNPWLLYFTGYYENTLTNSLLHNFNHLHFVMVGSIWIFALIGIDPMPRMGYPIRLLAVFVTLPFHAFLGVTIMNENTIIAREHYESLIRDWGPSVAEDQQLAGGLLWMAGDIVGLALFLVLMIQWSRSSDREAKRLDRELDRQEAISRGSQSHDSQGQDSQQLG
jgi:putative copper resistance protein D